MSIGWKMPASRCVGMNNARENLSAIAKDVKRTGKDVWLGRTQDNALSCFISVRSFERDGEEVYPAGVEDCDIEHLRKRFSTIRNHIVNTGCSRKVLVNGAAACMLVPTTTAYSHAVEPVRRTIEKEVRSVLEKEVVASYIGKQIAALVQSNADIVQANLATRKEVAMMRENTLSPEEVRELRALRALVKEMLPDWRESKGLPRYPQQ